MATITNVRHRARKAASAAKAAAAQPSSDEAVREAIKILGDLAKAVEDLASIVAHLESKVVR